MTQITKVYLLHTPLENDYKNTLYFEDSSTQLAYFQSRIVKSYTDFSYQRKDSFIRVPDHFDDLQGVNYVMYQNTQYSNKWFYAFITDLKYVNDERTDVYIETDCMQTWMFNITVQPSFVEREHVSDDTAGKHTVEENLEKGEYRVNSHIQDTNISSGLKLVVGSTETPSGEGASYGGTYNGIYSGVKYYTYDAENMTKNLQYLADSTKEDAVSSLFLAPEFLLPQTGGGPVSESDSCQTYEISVSPVASLDSYVPVNKKLLTYPYCYILASNANGANAIYHQEKFTNTNSDGNYQFRVYGALTPGCSIKMVPLYYNGMTANVDEGINLGKFPQLNWATDMYTNWLTQNGVSIAINSAAAGIELAGAVGLMGTPGGQVAGATMATSTVLNIANSMNEIRKAHLAPPQTSGNINCGDVLTSMGQNTFHLYKMSIKAEYARIIDGYFNMFGYKVNRVKVPNKAHRARYWYTKTIDVNIDGYIPNKDMQKIKNAYDRGITFWRNLTGVGDYSTANGISISSEAVTDEG